MLKDRNTLFKGCIGLITQLMRSETMKGKKMINKLIDVYNKWGDKNNLQPLGSADEELLGRKNLTKEQREWLEKFIEVWNNQEEVDSFIYENTEQRKG